MSNELEACCQSRPHYHANSPPSPPTGKHDYLPKHKPKKNYHYEMPSLVRALQDGWLTTAQAAAVVSALFAGIAAQLLTFVKDDSNFQKHPDLSTRHYPGRIFLLIVTYGSLFFNSSATFTSVLLTSQLAALPVHAAQDFEALAVVEKENPDLGTTNDILKRFKIDSTWNLVLCHWLFSLVLGITCTMLLVIAYIWLEELVEVKITMTVVVIGTIVYPMVLFFVPFCRAP